MTKNGTYQCSASKRRNDGIKSFEKIGNEIHINYHKRDVIIGANRNASSQYIEPMIICNESEIITFINAIRRDTKKVDAFFGQPKRAIPVSLKSAMGIKLIEFVDGYILVKIDSNRQILPWTVDKAPTKIKIRLDLIDKKDNEYFQFYRTASTKTPAVKVYYKP